MPFIDKSPLNYPVNAYDPIRRFRTTRAPTVADYKNFKIGDEWLDDSSNDWWKLCYKDTTQGIWRRMAGTAAAAELFTPDVGGQVGPDALNNINVLGGGGITVTGTPAANLLTIAPSGGGSLLETITPDSGGAVGPDATGTINYLGDSGAYLNGIHFTGDPANNTITAMDLRNITVYVVDAVAGQTEYQTVQAAINAANADGGGTVYVRPGVYTEDLVLYNAVDITAAVATPAGYQTTITGAHTPPDAGAVSFRNLALTDTTNVLLSAAAGATTIVMIDCVTVVDDGYTFALPNWTGLIVAMNTHCLGTEDGFADIGAGAASLLALTCTLGVGAANVGTLGGTSRIVGCNVQCSFDFVDQGIGMVRGCQFINTTLISDDATAWFNHCFFITDDAVPINQTSSLPIYLNHVTIDSTAAPDVIIGTGTVVMGVLIFEQAQGINAGITQNAPEYQRTGPIEIIPSDESVAAEDAWIKFNIPSGGGFSNGIDNSDTDNFKLTDGVDPSTGTEYYSLDVAASRWEFPINIFEQEISNEGGAVSHFISNTENTDPASDAACQILTGGASGGDPFVHLEVESVQEYSFGIDNNDADVLCITDGGSPSAGNKMWRMTTAGERTMPLQSTFLALADVNAQNNVTGNNALYTVIFATEVLDYNADFDGTSTFTAPVTGAYRFNTTVNYQQLDALATKGVLYIQTSNRLYQSGAASYATLRNVDGTLHQNNAVIADMDAADTCVVQIKVENMAGNTVDTGADGSLCYFGGSLEY